jgi:hypothetical protein
MRARKALQQVKRLAQECRIEIQEVKKTTVDPKKVDTSPG